MPQYYPKSQVTLNLFTNGQEYKSFSTDKEYIGYYYKTSNGEIFAGRNFESLTQEKLIPILPLKEEFHNLPIADNNVYSLKEDEDLYITNDPTPPYPIGGIDLIPNNFLITSYPDPNSSSPRSIPTQFKSTPTPEDIRVGEYRRYFAKKINEIQYMEINKETYTKFKEKNPTVAFDLYEVAFLPWDLENTQSSFSTNSRILSLTEKNNNWWGFRLYFERYLA